MNIRKFIKQTSSFWNIAVVEFTCDGLIHSEGHAMAYKKHPINAITWNRILYYVDGALLQPPVTVLQANSLVIQHALHAGLICWYVEVSSYCKKKKTFINKMFFIEIFYSSKVEGLFPWCWWWDDISNRTFFYAKAPRGGLQYSDRKPGCTSIEVIVGQHKRLSHEI